MVFSAAWLHLHLEKFGARSEMRTNPSTAGTSTSTSTHQRSTERVSGVFTSCLLVSPACSNGASIIQLCAIAWRVQRSHPFHFPLFPDFSFHFSLCLAAREGRPFSFDKRLAGIGLIRRLNHYHFKLSTEELAHVRLLLLKEDLTRCKGQTFLLGIRGTALGDSGRLETARPITAQSFAV